MPLETITAGSLSQIDRVWVPKRSAPLDGNAALLYNSANLVWQSKRQGESSWTTITKANPVGGLGNWASGGFLSDGRGWYEVGYPDSAIADAAGVRYCDFRLYDSDAGQGLDMVDVMWTVGLEKIDRQDASNGGLGTLSTLMSRLTEARLSELDAGSSGKLAHHIASVISPRMPVSGTLSTSADVDNLGYFQYMTWDAPAWIERVNSGDPSQSMTITIRTYDDDQVAADAAALPTIALTDSGTKADRSTEFALSAVSDVGAGVYEFTITNADTLTTKPIVLSATATVDGKVRQVHQTVEITDLSIQGFNASDRTNLSTLLTRLTAARATNLDNLDASISAIFSTAATESYGTDGSSLTPAQLLYLVYARLFDFELSGTDILIKGLDGTTTVAKIQMNQAYNASPTSSTRVSP